MKKKKRTGDCYSSSFRFILDSPSSRWKGKDYPRVIHGTVYSIHFGRRIKHAWIEFDSGGVLDTASGHFFYSDQWKRIANPRKLHSYSKEQAMGMAVRYGTYGPWEGYLGPYPSTYGYDKKEQARAKKIHNRKRR